MTMVEIERKFLVKSLPDEVQGGTPILQGYLAHDEHMEVRIRQYGNKHFLTVKEGAGLMRRETEVEISPQQFHALWPSTEGRRLEKVRSLVDHGSCRVEVDRYLGDLEPLLVAEVEFSSVEESEASRSRTIWGRKSRRWRPTRTFPSPSTGFPKGRPWSTRSGRSPSCFAEGVCTS